MQKTFTSFDLAAVISEIREKLKGARMQNIYQVKGKAFVLKLHQSGQPALNLLIDPGRRLHLTSYVLEKPETPPAFCMNLRKYLRNSTITEISQYEFERIVIIKARTKEGEFKLVAELFGDGNIILVDSEGIIRQALLFKKMRDRDILRGEPFHQAPPSGNNPLHVGRLDFLALKDFKSLEVVKGLTKLLSIGGTYAEEILLRAEVDKNKECGLLEDDDLNLMFAALEEILSPLEIGKLEPRIIIDQTDRWIDVVPILLKRYESLGFKEYKIFSEALDDFYAKTLVQQEISKASGKVEEEMARQKRILQEQQEALEETRKEAERMRSTGNKTYLYFHQLQTLLQRIMDEKRSGETWQNIVSKLQEEKKAGKMPSGFFESIEPKRLILNVTVDGLPFSLELTKTIQDNAAICYEQAKKTEKKVEGAKRAIVGTLRRMEDLEQRKKLAIDEVGKLVAKKRREREAWYEKFRWFYTSEGFLVVGGKDAVTNEILIKKYMDPHDLVFHADIAGSPFALIKANGKQPSEQSINEAAQLAASHSRAWRAKFSAIDVYWVHPEQVSKKVPSGEYIQKGAFMIRGKKNYVRKTPLHLAIGVDAKNDPPTIIGGPKAAVQSKTDIIVEIVPGDLPSRELANKIRTALKHKAPRSLQEKIGQIPIEKIQVFIPFGKGEACH